jgi:hypothetical protein
MAGACTIESPPPCLAAAEMQPECDTDYETQLKKACSDLETGTDLPSLLRVSRLLHKTRLKLPEDVKKTMTILHFQLDSPEDNLRESIFEIDEKFDVTSVKKALAASKSDFAALDPNTALPVHWFHVSTYHDSGKQPECADRRALKELGNAIGISSIVISNTMDNYSNGKICSEFGPDCVGIAFVDLVRVDESGRVVDAPNHLRRAGLPKSQSTESFRDSEPQDPSIINVTTETASRIKTIQQQPIAVFYSPKTNACLSIRVAPPMSGKETAETSKLSSPLQFQVGNWKGIVTQLQGKHSLLHKKMDSAYLLFLLIAEVMNTIEPLLSTYGDALEGIDFLFDEYEPTVRRMMMSRKIQSDLWHRILKVLSVVTLYCKRIRVLTCENFYQGDQALGLVDVFHRRGPAGGPVGHFHPQSGEALENACDAEQAAVGDRGRLDQKGGLAGGFLQPDAGDGDQQPALQSHHVHNCHDAAPVLHGRLRHELRRWDVGA